MPKAFPKELREDVIRVHRGSDAAVAQVAKVLRYFPSCEADSYGRRATQRLSPAQWPRFYGVYGHMHVCENDHGDRGDLDISTILKYANRLPTPTAAAHRWLTRSV